MKKLTITLSIICMAVAAMAQTYTGTVKDIKGEPIPFANVILHTLPDSTLVTGITTSEKGNFELKCRKIDNAYIEISCIGYNVVTLPAQADMGTVTLTEAVQKLGEVVISGKRIERNVTGYKINLKNEKSTKGKQVSELLPFLPGVTKEKETLKVFGRKVSIIYIDGVKIRNPKELDAIPAAYLSSAQIDYMAGSNESANTKGAVIHITLNKKKNNGYYGSAGGGVMLMPKYGYTGDNIFAVINCKYNKLNIYNNLFYSNNKAIGDFKEYKLFKQTNDEISAEEKHRSWSRNFADRLSLTYDFNKKNELGVSLFAVINNGKPKNKIDSKEIVNNITTPYKTETKTPYDYQLFQITSNYKHQFDTKGSEIKITADYLRNNENDKVKQKKIVPNPTFAKSSSDAVTNMFELDAKAKWVFKSKNNLQVGVNYKLVNADYDKIDFSGVKEVSDLSGRIPSVYAQFSGKKNKLSYKIGMRMQENTIKYTDKSHSLSSKNSDLDLYPSLNLMYLLNPEKGNIFMLSYKRSVDDIPYSAINPYKRYSSKYFYTVGNPNLISPKTDFITAVLDLYGRITLSSIYMYSHNPIYYETFVDKDNASISYTMPENGNYESIFAVSLEGRFKPVKWWQLKATSGYVLYGIKAQSFKETNQSKFYFSVNNDFTLSKTAGATLRAFYEPTYHMRDRKFHNVCDVKGSIYKRFLNNKLEAKLTCKLFRKGRFLETNAPQVYTSSDNITKENYFNFSIKYFFKGGKKVNVKQTNSIQNYNKISDIK